MYFLPTSRSQLLQQAQKSPVVHALTQRFTESSMNAPSTLPGPYKTYGEVKSELVEAGRARTAYTFAKGVVGFYKDGLRNVWRNRSAASALSRKYCLRQVTNRGKLVEIRSQNVTKVTCDMAQAIYMQGIESKSLEENSVVRHEEKGALLRMSRAEFQTLRRTSQDWPKLPLFAAIFALCMEFTPLVCYLAPNVAPSTCVIPSMLGRVWPTQKMKVDGDLVQISAQNAYNLPTPDVRTLARNLRLVPKFFPVAWYPVSFLRNRLQDYYNYLVVDNYYLSGQNGDGNVWNLSHGELVVACLERNLGFTSENAMRAELFRFLVNFSDNNVGYLKAQHGLEPANTDLETLLDTKN